VVARSVGVEEEVLLVDPASGIPCPVSLPALGCAAGPTAEVLDAELQRQQLEIRTEPCRTLTELDAQLRATRRTAAGAAHAVGAAVAALATSPLPIRPTPTPGERYERMAERFAVLPDELLTCGCHVHVEVDSGEQGVAVLDRIRVWLPVLLALSSNSPFWQGADSGYASFRRQVWGRWPSAGPTEVFGSQAEYQAAVRAMLDTATVLDAGMIYFDARLSQDLPTIEVRVPDVCLFSEDVVLLAALTRGLVETAVREWQAGRPPPPVRADVLRLASWRAARYGMEGELVHPGTGRPAPARGVLADLVDRVRPALADADDLDVVSGLLAALLARGSGASVQREVYRRTGRLSAVVAHAVANTVRRVTATRCAKRSTPTGAVSVEAGEHVERDGVGVPAERAVPARAPGPDLGEPTGVLGGHTDGVQVGIGTAGRIQDA
jgi:YbdK family carboxylate-amine ligase